MASSSMWARSSIGMTSGPPAPMPASVANVPEWPSPKPYGMMTRPVAVALTVRQGTRQTTGSPVDTDVEAMAVAVTGAHGGGTRCCRRRRPPAAVVLRPEDAYGQFTAICLSD
jgi:hypothetical protein